MQMLGGRGDPVAVALIMTKSSNWNSGVGGSSKSAASYQSLEVAVTSMILMIHSVLNWTYGIYNVENNHNSQ